MELRHLRYFLAVADASHFRRAAESLHVSQPTLSQQIQRLEKELETTLFDRIGKRVRLTVAGETLRHYARRVLLELDEAQVALLEPLAYTKKFRPGEEPGRRFFSRMREYTIMGFYTSEVGLKELDFPGLEFYAESPACPHHDDPEHRHLPPPQF